jgi:hypothetical protein
LLIKLGNEDATIKVLIDKFDNVGEIVELAVKLNINDDKLWDQILLKYNGKTDMVNQLLEYMDVYSRPVTKLY